MPEAAMNKDYSFQSREYKIRRARKVFPMKTKTEPHSMYQLSDYHFRLRILTLNTSHHLRTLFGRNDIHSITRSAMNAHNMLGGPSQGLRECRIHGKFSSVISSHNRPDLRVTDGSCKIGMPGEFSIYTSRTQNPPLISRTIPASRLHRPLRRSSAL